MLFLHSHCWMAGSLHCHPHSQARPNGAQRPFHGRKKWGTLEVSHQPLNVSSWKFHSQFIHWPELTTLESTYAWQVEKLDSLPTALITTPELYKRYTESSHSPQEVYHYPHIKDEETDAQKGKATGPRSHSMCVTSEGSI